MTKVCTLGNQSSLEQLLSLIQTGEIVAMDNGPTGALICKDAQPLYEFKDRPVKQALSAWGDLGYFWENFRDKHYYSSATLPAVVASGIFEGRSFLRFKVSPMIEQNLDIPDKAISGSMLQVYSSSINDAFFGELQQAILKTVGKNYIYVTSTNKRGKTPARGEYGLIEWAEKFDLPLFLLPEKIRDQFNIFPKASFPIVEAQADRFVIRRDGWIDMEKLLTAANIPTITEVDTQ